jgi:hypothetical protein
MKDQYLFILLFILIDLRRKINDQVWGEKFYLVVRIVLVKDTKIGNN